MPSFWKNTTGGAARVILAIAKTIALRDVFVFGGLGMVFYGLRSIYEPAAWAFCGLIIFLIGMRR